MKNERDLQLFITSCNLGNAQPDSLEPWIPPDGLIQPVVSQPKYPTPGLNQTIHFQETDQFDIIVIGMQEATFDPPENAEKEQSTFQIKLPVLDPLLKTAEKHVTKNVTIVQKNVTNLTNLARSVDHTKKQKFTISEWNSGTTALHAMLDAWLPSYTRKVSFQRGQMRLEIYTTSDLEVEVAHVVAQNTGRGGLANKGGIVATLVIEGTQLSFVTAHLEAHEGLSKYQMRCSTIGDILHGTKYRAHDVSLTSHFTFVCGDLNFRTELPEQEHDGDEEKHKELVRDLVEKKDWQRLNEIDELKRALHQKHCLADFRTLFCNFPPTFKVERQPGYSYIEKRRPSYTDRILWKANHQLDNKVHPIVYEPCDDFASSDHKPIRAAFSLTLNEPYKLRPRMARHASSIRLRSHKKGRLDAKLGMKERLHLFVSEISCEFEALKETAPTTYVCLQVTPEDVLRKKESFVEHLRKRFKFGSFDGHAPKREGVKKRTKKGWPRSTNRKESWQPDWGEEDIHCIVKTHHSNGQPYDLTGAQLHIVVYSVAKAGEDSILGTFSFNLVEMLRGCKKLQAESLRAVNQSVRDINRRSSVKPGMLSRDVGQSADEPSSAFDDGMAAVDIDEPLMKSGIQVGRIKCSIETWWMNIRAEKLVTGSPKTIMTRLLHKSNDDMLEQINEDAPIATFSSRHTKPSPKRNGLFSH